MPSKEDYKKYNLLVVDDHRTMLQIMHSLLKQIGFMKIDIAMDGLAALEKMKLSRYDLIISDWNMPNMDGLQFLKAVRASTDPQVKTVPFILVTAESKPENIIAAKQAGVNNYIIKPLTVTTLQAKLNITLGIM